MFIEVSCSDLDRSFISLSAAYRKIHSKQNRFVTSFVTVSIHRSIIIAFPN
jgi:hypothetical protein